MLLIRNEVQGTDRLKAATLTAKSLSRDDQEVLDLSQKCSELGKELVSELDKLRLEKGRFRQAIRKSVLAYRRKAAVKEKQDLLDKYQRMLDTRILWRLDARSLRETQDVQCLDQSVQQLVHQLEQGNNTVAQLLANHKDILDRIEGDWIITRVLQQINNCSIASSSKRSTREKIGSKTLSMERAIGFLTQLPMTNQSHGLISANGLRLKMVYTGSVASQVQGNRH